LEAKRKSRKASTADQYQWFLGRLNLTGQLSDITPDDISRALKRIKSKSTNDHVLIALRIFFNWCIKRGYVEKNPTIGFTTHASPGRARVLSDQELFKIWRCTQHTDLPVTYLAIVKILLLTGMRRGECSALQSSWIKDDIITLPKEITKNGIEHAFPIGKTTQSLLSALLPSDATSQLLFPARGSATKPFNGWSKSKGALDKASGVSDWTLHDLRRTFRSNLGRLKVAPHIAERLVNHINSRSDMEQIYDRWTYMPEMKAAVDRYDEFLRNLFRVEPCGG
jgi:integrase